jgi:hypothetical protein
MKKLMRRFFPPKRGSAEAKQLLLATAKRVARLGLRLGDLHLLHIGEPQRGPVTFTGLRLAQDDVARQATA